MGQIIGVEGNEKHIEVVPAEFYFGEKDIKKQLGSYENHLEDNCQLKDLDITKLNKYF